MKVVTSKQMAEIESKAYSEGASESEFMEEAGSGVALVVNDYVERHDLAKQVLLLTAKGNNSGDAYVAGVNLLHLDYDVIALQTTPIAEASLLCRQNHERFLEEGGQVIDLNSAEDIVFPMNGIVIDALFGTGFRGKLGEPFAAIVEAVNKTGMPIISIDIPSGLDGETGIVDGVAIKAAETAFLGLPKLGYFLNDGWNHIGKLRYVDFGLSPRYFENTQTRYMMLHTELLHQIMPPIIPSRHKYEAGYVVGVAGSSGMSGSAILSSWSALCSGAGIVRLMHPSGMEDELASSPYELIKTDYKSPNDILKQLPRAKALFVGPGIGTGHDQLTLLKGLLPHVTIPTVLDADALTIIANNKIKLPEKTVLTPHHGEMARLLGSKAPVKIDEAYLNTCNAFAKDKGVTLILKGAPTFILNGEDTIFVNPIGDPGMATAGTGDVLTGLTASMLAQGANPLTASLLAVYLHALAGEYAASHLTSYCMTATDIIEHFPQAFHALIDVTG